MIGEQRRCWVGLMAILARKRKCRMMMNAGMRLGRTGRHVAGVFYVRLMNGSRKIVINALVSAVGFLGKAMKWK